LLAALIGAGIGCTLTDEPFEPIAIDATETKSEPTLPAGPAAPDSEPATGSETGLPTTGGNTEGVPNVRAPADQASLREPASAGEATEPDAGAPPVEGQTENAATVDAGPVVVDPPAVDPPAVDPPVVEPPVVVPVQEPPRNPCPGLSFGGSCYQLFDSFIPWNAAEQQCVSWGGHLASIESAEENSFLNRWPAELGISNGDGSGIWIGGTDAQQDGVFRWVAGSPFSFAGWAPGQPNDGAGVDCIEKRNDGAGQWYDRFCVDSLRYLCERPL
jgi:hypothetical protein